MSDFISPARMAQIYWNRKAHAAYYEIERHLKNFKDAPVTLAYWTEVMNVYLTRHKKS